MKRWISAFLLVSILFALNGCMKNAIKEDNIKEALPGVDPNSRVGRSVQVLLYHRLVGEDALVPYPDIIETKNDAALATVALERVIAGPSASMAHLSPAFPKETQLIDLRKDAEEVYTVIMSKELLEPNPSATTKTARDTDLQLRAYAIVNTICSVIPDSRVQILVDTDATGNGTRISPFLLGFDDHTEWLEPLERSEKYTATPETPLTLALDCLIRADYESAYLFFANEAIGVHKPALNAFQSALEAIGRINAYTLLDATLNSSAATGSALLDISYTDASGNEVLLEGVTIDLINEEAIWKVSYYSLLNVLGVTT